jgi:predicted secreted Zn-dependent protease
MAKIGWAVLVGIWCCVSARAGAPARATEKADTLITTNYSFFGGTNVALMRAAMIAARPWHQSMAWDAHTQWSIQTHYHYAREQGQFKLAALQVRTVVHTTLPWWAPRQAAAPALWTAWQKCFNGLRVHEQGHVDLAVAAGDEVLQKLKALPPFESVAELAAAANRTLKDTIASFRQRERHYDEETHHGQTQGAFWGWGGWRHHRAYDAGSRWNGQRPGIGN